MKETTCLIATVKNEGPWILEWVAHNKAIGFDHIIVGSNDCDDGTDLMLDRLQEMGVLSHFDNTGPYPQGIQIKAYDRARRFPQAEASDWIMALDADEFLNIHKGEGRLEDIIALHNPETDAIVFNWRNFGDSGLTEFEDRPVCEMFTMANDNPKQYSQVKTLFRNTHDYKYLTPHGPWLLSGQNEEGPNEKLSMRIRTAKNLFVRKDYLQMGAAPHSMHDSKNSWDAAQVNHYIVRTKDVYDLKRKRGRAVAIPTVRHTEQFFHQMNLNLVEDTSISRTFDARNAVLQGLRSDPRLAELHEQACDVLRKKLAEAEALKESLGLPSSTPG